MCKETDSKKPKKLSVVVWPCCFKRLFYGIYSFTISICDIISQFNDGANWEATT